MLIGYTRVSTDDQDHVPQLEALKAAGCARCFGDTAAGSLRDRPQLKRALEELRDGEDTLVVWRRDRLGRSLSHLIELMGELERRHLGFRSLTEGVDTTTPSRRLVFHIFGAIAEFERQLIRERTQAGLNVARARGRRGGRRTVMTEHSSGRARDARGGSAHDAGDRRHDRGGARDALPPSRARGAGRRWGGGAGAPIGVRLVSASGEHAGRSARYRGFGRHQLTIDTRGDRKASAGDARVRVDGISVGDIVKASIKGRTLYGEIREVADGVVRFLPLAHAAGWRHASAHEIVGHWRKTGRTSAGGDAVHAQAPREQLSLPGIHG